MMSKEVDIPAYEMLVAGIKLLTELPTPPDDLADMNQYKDDINKIFRNAAMTVGQVKDYADEVMKKFQEIRQALKDYSSVIAKAIKDALEKLRMNAAATRHSTSTSERTPQKTPAPYERNLVNLDRQLVQGITGNTRRTKTKDANLEALERAHALEQLANNLANNRLDELTMETERYIAKLQGGARLTETDIADLNGNCTAFVEKTKHSFEEQKRFQEEEEQRKEEEEQERLIREEQERFQEEEEQRKEEEEQERLFREEQKRFQEEEEQRKEEEEQERLIREEQKRFQEEEEQRKKEEEQERLIREEQERMRKENEEKERKEKEERDKAEAEQRRRTDPNNWPYFRYDCKVEGNDDEATGTKTGVCIFTALGENLAKDDIQCTMRDSQGVKNALGPGETLASKLFCLRPKTGRKEFEIDARAYINHIADVDNVNETCVKMSVNGGPWTTYKALDLSKNIIITDSSLQFAGVTLNDFNEAKLIVVVRAKRSHQIVGKDGGTIRSDLNKNIKVRVPINTFDDATDVDLSTMSTSSDAIDTINKTLKDSLRVSSANHVIRINTNRTARGNLQVDLPINKKENDPDNPVYRLVSSTQPNEWSIASINKGSDSVSVSLPTGSDSYTLVEVSMPKKYTKADAIAAADTVYDHANRTAVVLLFHQLASDPKRARIQCVANYQVVDARKKMTEDGFTYGSQKSKMIYLRDGQEIQVFFSGNIARDSDDVGLLKITFFSNFRHTVQDVNLAVVNEFKQTEHQEFRGTLTCHIMEPGDLQCAERRTEYAVTLTTTLPKPEVVVQEVGLPYYMKSLAVFLASELAKCTKIGWRVLVKSITGDLAFNSLNRRSVDVPGDEGKCAFILYEWMKDSLELVQNLDDEDGKSPDEQIFGIIVGKLSHHGLKQIEKRCVSFLQTLKEQLSDNQLKELVSEWNGDIYTAGNKLGFSKSRIQKCLKRGPKEPRRQLIALLQEWRMSNRAADAGANAIAVLKHDLGLHKE